MNMNEVNGKIFACGEDFFIKLFSQVGFSTVNESITPQGFVEEFKKEKFVFAVFSQKAFEKFKDIFFEKFPQIPYIVFPYPEEKNKMEEEIKKLMEIAVGVSIE